MKLTKNKSMVLKSLYKKHTEMIGDRNSSKLEGKKERWDAICKEKYNRRVKKEEKHTINT